MGFFVKYPPLGDEHFRPPRTADTHWPDGHIEQAEWEPCTYGIEPEYAIASRGIDACRFQWERTGNTLYVLEAFRLANEAKLYPPLWVLRVLDERFSKAIHGNKTLDRAFGFSAKGLGRGRRIDPRTQDRLRSRDQLLSLAIFKLEGAGLSRAAACEALASRLSRLRPGEKLFIGGNSRLALERTEMTGKGIAKAVGAVEEEVRDLREATREAAESWTEDEKRQLLSDFYPSELPDSVVKALNL